MMVRPRGGSFVFSAAEVDSMRRDMDMVRELGADVVVIGLLNDDGTIDERTRANSSGAQAERPLPCISHSTRVPIKCARSMFSSTRASRAC